jgi:hypothetical protein
VQFESVIPGTVGTLSIADPGTQRRPVIGLPVFRVVHVILNVLLALEE